MEEKLSFVVKLLYKIINNEGVTSDEMQALENIVSELPEVDETNFRW